MIGFEDFSTGNIGDFTAAWNTDASAEIITIEGKPGRWLWFTKRGVFTPEFPAPMETDGKGESEPIDKNDSPDCNSTRADY